MSDSRTSDEQPPDVTTSESYSQDFVYAVRYALLGAVLFGAAAINFALLDTVRGRTAAAEFFSSFGPVTPSLGVDFAYFIGYVLLLFAVLSFVVVAYSGAVRPGMRATGMLDSASSTDESSDGADDDQQEDDRVVVMVTTTEGIQRFVPDTDCAECEQLATAVLAAAFDDGTPTRAVPLCAEHLGERREVLEDGPSPIEIELFSRSDVQ